MKLSDRQQRTIEKLEAIDSGNDFFWDEATGAAKFIKGKLSNPSSDAPEKIAKAFLDDNAGLLDLQEDLVESLEISQVENDKQGFSHVYFAQSLNDIPVFEGSTQVHINPAGEVIAYKDYRLAALDISLEPRISQQSAMETVLKDRGKESAAIAESKARLVVYRDTEKKTHLAWEIEWLGEDDLAASLHIIDAHSGSILLKHSRMREMASRLTYSAENTSDLRASLVIQDDQTTTDDVARAAHDHAETVYNYFLNTFERDSYDGRGADLVSTVHFKQNYNNAFWTDWYKQMVYGDGDGHRFAPRPS